MAYQGLNAGFPALWKLLLRKQKTRCLKISRFEGSCLLAITHCRGVWNTVCPGEPCFLLLLSKIQGKPLMRTSIPVSLFGELLFLFCILCLPRSTCMIKVVCWFRLIIWVWDTRTAGSMFHGPEHLSELTAILVSCCGRDLSGIMKDWQLYE